MIYQIQESFHKQNIFFSEEDIYVNYQDWLSGKARVLLVIGQSGSGKSTLAQKIAKEYDAKYVELDKFKGNKHYDDDFLYKTQPLLMKFFSLQPYTRDELNQKKSVNEERTKYIDWLINDIEDRIVIDGEQIVDYMLDHENDNDLYKIPAILKGTSIMKSEIRRFMRDISRYDKTDPMLYKYMFKYWANRMLPSIQKQNRLRDLILTKNNDQYDTYDESYNIINEAGKHGINIFFSEDDIYCNFDKFESGKNHTLFVLAIPGSGKSTLSKFLSKKYNAHYVELDVLTFKIVGEKAKDRGRQTYEYIKNADPMLYKYMKEKNIPPDYMNDIRSTTAENPTPSIKEEKLKQERASKYIHWLCFEQKERCIIDGGYVGPVIINSHDYDNLPITFKGTSILTSILRRMKRNNWDIISIIKKLPAFYEHTRKTVPEVNIARSKYISDDNFEYIKEPDIDSDINEEYKEPNTMVFMGDSKQILESSSNNDVTLNTIISGKDLYFNFDKWKSGESNTLFITGLSGSGKTTLGRNLASTYKCDLIELDMFWNLEKLKLEYIRSHCPLVYEYYKLKDLSIDWLDRVTQSQATDIYNDFMQWCINLKQPKIIEGIDVADYIVNNRLEDYPVIFKSTSALRSLFNRVKRDFTDYEGEEKFDTISNLLWWIKEYSGRAKDEQNTARDYMYSTNKKTPYIESSNLIPIKESVISDNIKVTMYFGDNTESHSPILWKDYTKAYYWYISEVVRRNIDTYKDHYDMKLYKPIIDQDTIKPYIIDKQYDIIMKQSIGLKTYIYTVQVPLSGLRFGSNTIIDEYISSYDNIDVLTREDIVITEDIFRNVFTSISEEEYYNMKSNNISEVDDLRLLVKDYYSKKGE